MNGAARILLPNGVWRGGSRHVDAVVRPITGEDEEFLLEGAADLSVSHRATAILARCVVRLGPIAPVGEEDVRALSAGDREALLLHLRRVSFGERLQSTVVCPACGAPLDLDVRTSDVLVPTGSAAAEFYDASINSEDGSYRLRFRPPTGADLEAAVAAAAEGVDVGVRVLVGRCVQESSRGEMPVAPEALPPSVVAGLSARIAELDPQAEIEFVLQCPACGEKFPSLLDAAGFLFEEIGLGVPNLYRELHTIALHYHWSERDILRLTTLKRRLYLELVRETLGEHDDS